VITTNNNNNNNNNNNSNRHILDIGILQIGAQKCSFISNIIKKKTTRML
jgi:hypothetical protein